MPRRQRNMTPWPLATAAEAEYYTIERTRTNAGAALLQKFSDVDAVFSRIGVRIEQVRIDPYGEASGIVFTRVDGGEWICEGGYLLSRKVGAPPIQARVAPPNYEPLPEDF